MKHQLLQRRVAGDSGGSNDGENGTNIYYSTSGRNGNDKDGSGLSGSCLDGSGGCGIDDDSGSCNGDGVKELEVHGRCGMGDRDVGCGLGSRDVGSGERMN